MESEESPRPKRGGCFACGARSPEAKREKKADVLFDVSKLDFSVATLIAVLGDDGQRAKFRQFLDSRYMGECLRLYTELESFEFERREAARSLMAHQIFSRFIDPSNETEETVTLSAEVVTQISKKLASKEYDRIYRDLATEMLVLMSANGLSDFLHSQHVPSLEDCFLDRRTFTKFLGFASRKEEVSFVDGVLAYEKKAPDELQAAGEALLGTFVRGKELRLAPESVAPIVGASETKRYERDTFEAAKKECLQRLMLDAYPNFVAKQRYV